MTPALDPEILERLRAVLARAPNVRLAVLFGSRAAGRAHSGSDFDIGILPGAEGTSLHEELALAATLSQAAGAEVDLVRLDVDNPLLGNEVARNGICLLEREPGAFSAYRATAVSIWLDWDETIAPHRARFLSRLAAGRG